jgi:hypothetical protein
MAIVTLRLNDDEARGSALKLAASSAAQELSSRMTTMGMR